MNSPAHPSWQVAPGVSVEVNGIGQVILFLSSGPLTCVRIFEPYDAKALAKALDEAAQKAPRP